MSENKVVVIGLDGACWDLLEPWLNDGQLPYLSSLVERGATASLTSCIPATTPPAWTTLTTGVGPGKHGVFGFYDYDRDNHQLTSVSDSSVNVRRLWDYLTEAEKQSLVVNVPVTHPPREIDGALVPGYLSPDQPGTHPESLLESVGMDDYSVYSPSEADESTPEVLLEEWLHLTRTRAELATRLTAKFEWNLLFLQFQKTDGAVHKFTDEERILDIYQQVDECLEELLSTIDEPVNVFLVSDHGIGQPKQWGVSLNTWLADEGYLATTVDNSRPDSWLEQATASNGEKTSSRSITHSGVPRLIDMFSWIGITRRRLEGMLSWLNLYGVARKITPDQLKQSIGTEQVDKFASDAFYVGMGFSGVDTGVFVNQDRFNTPTAYKEFRSELMEKLSSLHGPSGRAFSSVKRREDVYTRQSRMWELDWCSRF